MSPLRRIKREIGHGTTSTNGVKFEEMKIRLKKQAEKDFDKTDVEEKQLALNAACKDFVSEFIDCEGDVFYSTYNKAANSIWQYEQSVKNAAMTKVGPEWDHKAGVVGKWRYPHLRKDDD